MALDTARLEPKIHQILSAPGTDLSTISAKRVRRQLLETDPSLTAEYIKGHREEIDILISHVYERVSAQHNANDEDDEEAYSADESQSSRKRRHDDDDEDQGEDDAATPPPKKAKKSSQNGQKLSDEELARKLSKEINGRERTTRTSASSKGRGSKSRAKKSSTTVDSDGESDDDGGKKKAKKRKSGAAGGARGGLGKEFTLSEPLSNVLQVDKLSRPQVVKQLWVYIKDNGLQNPKNRREILCDANLKAVFGREKIDMFAMNKVLGEHLHEPAETL